jgi:hypothetical protein
MKISDIMKENNPYHQEYIVPEVKGTKDILKFMLARQKHLFNKTALELEGLSYVVLQTNIKRLLSEYSEKEVMWGICAALSVCDHPFSTSKVKELICDHFSTNS